MREQETSTNSVLSSTRLVNAGVQVLKPRERRRYSTSTIILNRAARFGTGVKRGSRVAADRVRYFFGQRARRLDRSMHPAISGASLMETKQRAWTEQF